jgi:hypothetical protein
VLDVKQRLSRTDVKKVAGAIGKFRHSDESNLLLRGVEADRFQDQPILRGFKPKALLRRPYEGFGSVGRRTPAPRVGAPLPYNGRNIAVGSPCLPHLHIPQHGAGEGEQFARTVVLGEHPVYVDRRQLESRVTGIGPGPLKLVFMIKLAKTHSEAIDFGAGAVGGLP